MRRSKRGRTSPRFAGSNRITQRPELSSTLLSPSASEGVDRISEFDLDQPSAADHRLPPCARQGTGDSTGPEVDVAKGFLWYRPLKADIRNGHTAFRPKDPRDLAIDAEFVGAEIDYAIRDHEVGPPVIHGQVLDDTLAKLDVLEPQLGGHRAAAIDHFRRHVDADHTAARSCPERRQE